MQRSILAAAAASLLLVSCVPVEPDMEGTTVTAGTYVLDGTSAWGTSTRSEWNLASSGALTVSHFRWDATDRSGCYDSVATGNSWALEDGRLHIAWGGSANIRPACDSAWRDVATPRTGSVRLRLRADTLGFGWYDSTASAWHVLRRL